MTRTNIILGVVVAIAIVVLAWLFLISPQNDELAQVEADIVAEQDQAVAVQAQIAGLEQVRSEAPQIEAEIAEVDSIVPSDPGLPSALRQLQAAADDAGVLLTAVTPSRPSPVADGEATGLHVMGMSMTLEGSYFQTVDFLRRLEDPSITARGMEVTSVSLAKSDDLYPTLTVSITAQSYAVLDAPPVPAEPAPEPPPTTDAETDGEGESEGDAESDESDETETDDEDAPASDEGEELS